MKKHTLVIWIVATSVTTAAHVTRAATSTPFTGQPATIPGTIHAENFDDGGEGVAYHDNSPGNYGGRYRTTDVDIQTSSLGGFNVGWIADGEWLGYSVFVGATGSYDVQLQVASLFSTGRMRIVFGTTSTPTITIPNTGAWQTWTTVNVTVPLTAGPQVMRLMFDGGNFNIAALTFSTRATTTAPTTYAAVTDRTPRPKPAVPAVGAAGSHFSDPTFGSRLLRVTDAHTRTASPNLSYRTPSASPQIAWNATSTRFYVGSTDGTILPYDFDAASMTATRVAAPGTDGLTLNFYIEPQFSSADPNAIYGAMNTGNPRTVSKYDFASGTYAPIVALDSLVPGLAGYVGGVMTGGTPTEDMTVFFGGASQDQHRYLLWFPVANLNARKLLDTVASTLNGAATTTALNFHLHAVTIDRSGRYVFLYPAAADSASPRFASPAYVWDTATDVFTALTTGGADGSPNTHPGGHGVAGFGVAINHDCCVTPPWDAGQWLMRTLATPLVAWNLIQPVLTPQEVFLSDHASWANASASTSTPIVSATFRYGNNTAPWRAWDDEIIAIETDQPAGTGAAVWRFAHHRSDVSSDASPTTPEFWYEPRPNVSPNGRWAIFTSNWEKTLGADPRVNTHRQDVFLVELK
ncbi:MAG TPA: carbohydrate-binding protein [Vicinamibacterales bacterium]|jgi:hypothetical protein